MGKSLKISLGFIITLSAVFCFRKDSFAHPGNVSSDGCHFCHANCEEWGYTFETRHGHNGETCDPSKGPIDPLHHGGGSSAQPNSEPSESVVTPTQVIPTIIPTPRPTRKPTAIPKPTSTPTLEPSSTLEPSLTIEPTFTATPTAGKILGDQLQTPKRRSFWQLLFSILFWPFSGNR